MPSNVMQSVPPEEIMRNAYVLSSDIDLLHDLLEFKHQCTNETLQQVRNALKDIRSRKTQLRLLAQGGYVDGVLGRKGLRGDKLGQREQDSGRNCIS